MHDLSYSQALLGFSRITTGGIMYWPVGNYRSNRNNPVFEFLPVCIWILGNSHIDSQGIEAEAQK